MFGYLAYRHPKPLIVHKNLVLWTKTSRNWLDRLLNVLELGCSAPRHVTLDVYETVKLQLTKSQRQEFGSKGSRYEDIIVNTVDAVSWPCPAGSLINDKGLKNSSEPMKNANSLITAGNNQD